MPNKRSGVADHVETGAAVRRLTRRTLIAGAGVTAALGSRGAMANAARRPFVLSRRQDSRQTLRVLADRAGFRIGCLFDGRLFGAPTFNGEEHYEELFAQEFNLALIDGGPLDWGGYGVLRPRPEDFEFGYADPVVDFAERHDVQIEGHHLAWGRPDALPKWLKDGGYAPDQILDILRGHVRTVVGHYKGRIRRWSVVNEPFNSAGFFSTGPEGGLVERQRPLE